MKVTQEKRPASQVGLEIEIPPERLKKVYEQVIQKFTREFNFPGFRKGKVPRQVLVQRFGDRRLKATALEDVINQGIQQAIEQEKLQIIGDFDLTSSFEDLVDKFDLQQPLTFSVVVDVQPDVTLHAYQGFSIQAEEVKPDLTRVDQLLDDRRREIATLIPVEDRPAQLEDVAILDFKGRLVIDDNATLTEEDQQAVDILEKEMTDFQVDIVNDRFIPGFIDGIVGMTLEETKDIAVQFPDDYIQPQLAGKSVVFTVTLKELKARELPALDDDFAQEVSEFETLAELRASLEERFTGEAEDKTRANKENALVTELLKHVEIELPATMITREVDYLLEQSAARLRKQGLSLEQMFGEEEIQEFRKKLEPDAISRLKQRLALREIAKRESIEADPDKFAATISEYTSALSDMNVDPEMLRMAVYQDLTDEKVLEWIEANSTIELVPEGTLQQQMALDDVTDPITDAPSTSQIDPSAEVAATRSQDTVDVTAVEVPDEMLGEAPTSDDAPEVEAPVDSNPSLDDNLPEAIDGSEPDDAADAHPSDDTSEDTKTTTKKKKAKAKPKADE